MYVKTLMNPIKGHANETNYISVPQFRISFLILHMRLYTKRINSNDMFTSDTAERKRTNHSTSIALHYFNTDRLWRPHKMKIYNRNTHLNMNKEKRKIFFYYEIINTSYLFG